MSSESEIRKGKIYRITIAGSIVNLVLSLLKLVAGIVGRSGAMVADAVHSFSDLATDVVVIAFARISSKPKDDDHDYGHGKYETLATIIISLALGVVGAGIWIKSIDDIHFVFRGGELERPGLIAFVAALVSIVVKEVLYRYTCEAGLSNRDVRNKATGERRSSRPMARDELSRCIPCAAMAAQIPIHMHTHRKNI